MKKVFHMRRGKHVNVLILSYSYLKCTHRVLPAGRGTFNEENLAEVREPAKACHLSISLFA